MPQVTLSDEDVAALELAKSEMAARRANFHEEWQATTLRDYGAYMKSERDRAHKSVLVIDRLLTELPREEN